MEQINAQEEEMQRQKQEEERQKIIQLIKEMDSNELIEFLNQRHPSECYLIIRDIITVFQEKAILKDDNLKSKFKKIQSNAKKSWDNDHKQAMILDVNNATNQLYNHLSNIIMKLNNDMQELKKQLDDLKGISNEKPSIEEIKEILNPEN